MNDKRKHPTVGKRVGGWLYVHRSALSRLPEEIGRKVRDAESVSQATDWNVVKIRSEAVGLLTYADFDEHPFPALLHSASVELTAGTTKSIDYSTRENPPILHRKELLLLPEDPRIPRFAALTRAAEGHGLFSEPTKIGTKKAWSDKIDAAGLVLDGHALRERGAQTRTVHRFKTAIQRSGLSQPINLMLRFGMADRSTSIFDYGCGRGSDVGILRENGYQVFGWDPVHAPDGERRKADIVNLGFVLNVIEDPHERLETLKAAWSFARNGIVVSVMSAGKTDTTKLQPYGDGFLSGWDTFQKYFTQDELRRLLSEVTGEPPVNFAPGIVAAFRDKDLEQRVLFRRKSRSVALGMNVSIPPRTHIPQTKKSRPVIRDVLREELEELWRLVIELGRSPGPEEMPDDLVAAISGKGFRVEAAVSESLAAFGDETTLEAAAAARREDLLVHFAVGLFPGAVKYGELPISIRRDVRAFFGSHANVLSQARSVLTEIGNVNTLIDAAVKASSDVVGSLSEDGTFYMSMDSERSLPVPLRIMIGCAEILDKSFMTSDFLIVDLKTRYIKGIRCDDISRPIPKIVEEFHVHLGKAASSRKYPRDKALYLKSKYLPASEEKRDLQLKIDENLRKTGLVDENGKGPSHSQLSIIFSQSHSN
ncbi:DNA phosphorothioation-associated putative methyltransferase [Roseibium suaedae]|nr:DNA phosphorothioation-associated putative methyltransferase [Roseibium suaedae]